jgi:hypothetical protein
MRLTTSIWGPVSSAVPNEGGTGHSDAADCAGSGEGGDAGLSLSACFKSYQEIQQKQTRR